MSKNKTTARFFKAVLCTIAFAGCSASGTTQKNGIQAFADKYTAADKSAQIVVRNQEREVILTEEEFEKEKEAARPKLITPDCSKEAVDAGMKAYYEFETAYRKDMLKVIAEAETEKIDAFTADAMNEYISFECKEDVFDTTKNDKLTIYNDGTIILRTGKEKTYFKTDAKLIDTLNTTWHSDWEMYYTKDSKPCWVHVDADGNPAE